MTTAGSTTYSYDGNGNETDNSAGLSLAYNAQDQTTSATPPGGSATSYSYTDQGQPQRATAGSTAFQYDVTGLSVMTTITGTTYFTRLPDGTLLSERTPSGTDYYLVDGLGSTLAVTNSAGSVVNSYSYDPYPAVILGMRLELPDTLRFYARLGYRVVGEESHPGYTTPTFAWLRKDLTDENNGTS